MRCAWWLLLVGAVGCGGNATARPDPVADERVRLEVERRLRSEPALAGRPLRVDVRDGVVALYGQVDGLGRWRCALLHAELTPGVRSVVDHLEVVAGPVHVSCQAQPPAR